MKKLLALLVVVAMLAVAGSAFAATGGHGGSQGTTEKTGTTTVITQIVEKIVTTVTRTVTVISQTVQQSAVVETFTEVTQTITEKITTTVLTKVEGFTEALANTWAAKATEVEEKKEAAKASPTVQSALKTGKASNIDATPKPSSKLKPVEKVVANTGTPAPEKTAEEKLATATDNLGITGASALSATDPVTPEEDGAYDFPKTFGSRLYNTKISGSRGGKGVKSGAAFYAADVDNDGVIFLNSSGDQITEIPGDENSQDIMPGFVNMVVLMEAGEIYEPVIYATPEALAEAGLETTSVAVSVDVTEYVTQVTVIDENGNVTVTTEASASELDFLADKFGVARATFKNIPATAYASVSADTVGTDPDQYIAFSMPAFNGLEDGTYYYGPFSYDIAPNEDSYDVPADALMTFYADGFKSGNAKEKKLFQTSDGENFTEVTNTSADALFGTTGNYIVFTVSGSDLVTVSDVEGVHASEYSMPAPILAVSVTEKDGDDEDYQTLGGSSGGCTTGISALGLAVLGLFAAKRKK